MSSNDVTVVCFCILGGKNLCACVVELWQLACASTGIPTCFPYPATHEPLLIFRIPIFVPGTYVLEHSQLQHLLHILLTNMCQKQIGPPNGA